jgi:hypothetical protein
MADVQIATLFMFFIGVACCFVRWPQADRWHLGLTVVAAALWAGCLVLEPRTRTLMFGLIVLGFLSIAVSRPLKRER